ncbi:hypothetical protein S40285_09523 [Stachybotrys chlorohalonatus IBT 40285]|uniref:Bacteriophage T5 Orf172 DNA-binding domain-containing protein n=1 Tax=Stachybotrys chlorohalonatus (strain IBT 40285) TaxID=1283841 RepID=A0A084R1Z4_STAC4|nr:hypothetical protein S40285_09523 [Stachybotrys chlorohalonata IBT 40285]
MATLPTAAQFPSLKDTRAFLKEASQQCIWYLPNPQRLCLCKITPEDVNEAVGLLEKVKKPRLSVDERLKILEEVAELCCCPRHHRSKIYGTKLGEKVARIWYEELKLMSTPSPSKKAQPVVVAVPASPRRMFARHQVHTTESISSQLCSNLDLNTGTSGSIYIYTHEASVFSGMIKIGYTCQSIASRLLDWGDCGHGEPTLLASISNVRHPERVELLTHFELIDVWHEMMWCKPHGRTHIEWFKTDEDKAKDIATRWNTWVHEANPYDRRGKLKEGWEKWCAWLQKKGYAVNSNNMLWLHEWEVGKRKKIAEAEETEKRAEATRRSEVKVKKEEEEDECPLGSVPSRREKTSYSTRGQKVKVEESRARRG